MTNFEETMSIIFTVFLISVIIACWVIIALVLIMIFQIV